MAAIKQILQLHRRQLQGLIENRGIKRLAKIYSQSRAELSQRLSAVTAAGKGASFNAHHMRVMLAQTQDVIKQFENALGEHLDQTGTLVSAQAPKHLLASVRELEKHFGSHTPVIPVDQVALFQKMHKGVDASLLDRFHKSKRLYGAPVVSKIREQLALSLVQGQTVDDAVDRVSGTSGIFAGQRWRAERIVRTELSYASNYSTFKSMQVLAQEPGAPRYKKLIETMDDRTGDDSKILNGQIRPVDSPFVYHPPAGKKGYPPFLAPPGRPNDRATMIPWDPEWGP